MCQSGVVDDGSGFGLALVALEIAAVVVSVCPVIGVMVVGRSVDSVAAGAAAVVVAIAVVILVVAVVIVSVSLECASATDAVVESDVGRKIYTHIINKI